MVRSTLVINDATPRLTHSSLKSSSSWIQPKPSAKVVVHFFGPLSDCTTDAALRSLPDLFPSRKEAAPPRRGADLNQHTLVGAFGLVQLEARGNVWVQRWIESGRSSRLITMWGKKRWLSSRSKQTDIS